MDGHRHPDRAAGDSAMALKTFRLGGALVEVGDKEVITTFADGASVTAAIDEQPGQAELAARLGMTVESMNRSHDLAHSVLAVIMGLDVSPTLWAVAHGRTWPGWWREEAAVLELQGLANALGVTMIELAEKYNGRKP